MGVQSKDTRRKKIGVGDLVVRISCVCFARGEGGGEKIDGTH